MSNAQQSGNVKVVQLTWGIAIQSANAHRGVAGDRMARGFELFQPGTVERNAMRVSAKALL